MWKPFLVFFVTLQFLSGDLVYGQQDDSLSLGTIGPTDSAQLANAKPDRRDLYINLGVPAAMITYGVLALNSPPLLHFNREVRNIVASENSYYGTFHLENYLQWTPVLATYGLNLFGIKGKNNFRDRTIIYGISIILMSTTVAEVKKISGEIRPDGFSPYSFPSGHTANAFANAEFMRHEYKDVSPWYAVGGYAAAAVTGYLRMYHNRHWLSDVIGGAGIGILSANAAYLIYPVIKRTFFEKDRNSSTIILPAYQNGVVSIGAIHIF